MRASTSPVAAVLGAALAGAMSTPAVAAPAACGGVPEVTDAIGDGHHPNTDVTAAWFSEQGGLRAVIRPRTAVFGPVHEDSEAAGFALVFEVDGVRRYVRAEAPRTGAMRYDHGTWNGSGFVSSGPTTGAVESGSGGAVIIDVPGVPAGTRLSRPFALTYDGEDAPGVVHWVDRAPGGTSPAGTEFGADLVVGTCGLAAGGGTPAPTPGAGGETGAGTMAPSPGSVALLAPRRVTGAKTVRVTGTVRPATGGVPVTLRLQAGRTTTRTTTTAGDGGFVLRVPIGETTKLRATAGGLDSQTLTVTVRSTVRVRVRRAKAGGVIVTGAVRPKLPGRVLWLRDGAFSPSATTTAKGGSFRLRLSRPRAGRYQAVFIPSGRRAERSTSNTGVIR